MQRLLQVIPCLFAFAACQTTMPPAELTQARDSVKAAEEADVDDLMPSSMELANRQLDEAENLWEQSKDRRDENQFEEATALEEQATQKAKSAYSIAETGLQVKSKVSEWDQDPRQYNELTTLAANSEEMSQLYAEALATARRNANQEVETELVTGDVLESVPLAFFDTSKAEVRENDQETIAKAADFLKKHQTARVVLKGSADPRGSDSLNKDLAKNRAQAVAKSLRDHGVAEDQIEIVETDLSDSKQMKDKGAAAWQLDRKVSATFETGVAH